MLQGGVSTPFGGLTEVSEEFQFGSVPSRPNTSVFGLLFPSGQRPEIRVQIDWVRIRGQSGDQGEHKARKDRQLCSGVVLLEDEEAARQGPGLPWSYWGDSPLTSSHQGGWRLQAAGWLSAADPLCCMML